MDEESIKVNEENNAQKPDISNPLFLAMQNPEEGALLKNTLNQLRPKEEFVVPKKPEKPIETIKTKDIKSSVDVSRKEFGSKTLTPTVNIEAEDLFPKKEPIKPVQRSENIDTIKAPPSSAEDILAIPSIRTYKEDVAENIKDQKTSLIRMVLEEQRVKAKKELNESPQSRKNLPLIFFSFVFLLSSVGITYYAFLRPTPNTVDFSKLNVVPLVGTENNKEILIENQTAKELSKEIKSELTNTDIKLDTIEYIYFTEKYLMPTEKGDVEARKIVKIDSVLGSLEILAPQNFLRSLKSDYMFGFHNFNGNQPFLVLKTDYYDTAFAGMLEWEKTLYKDITPLFGKITNDNLESRGWIDLVLKNKDTRVLRDFNDKTVLIYMFKDTKTLIISTSENTLFEVSRRMDTLLEKK